MILTPNNTIKFLYSYNGKILPRATDGELRYVGGHTRVLTVDRSVSFSELRVKLVELCGSSVTLRCQLPNGDLETLVSITNDEDLANIIEEYDRASSKLPHPLKIRVILFPPRSIKKVSPLPSSSSSSATPSPSRSTHTSDDSLPYVPTAYGAGRRSRVATVGCPNGSVVRCCCNIKYDGNPRFFYRGAHRNNYCR